MNPRGPRRLGFLALVAATLPACSRPLAFTLPAPPPPAPECTRGAGRLLAGFGKADITPPPGPGLQGNGPDGRIAAGHRHRLFARAMVLQDPDGRRVAFVVADLPQVSAILQREAVRPDRVPPELCLGPAHVMLSATHAHAGPGNFFLSQVVNTGGSPVSGYDSVMVAFLADGFARAIRAAVDHLRPAAAAWGTHDIWGATRNRSLEAYLRDRPNPLLLPRPTAPPRLPARYLAITPTFTLLRVDTITVQDGVEHRVPAGAFSSFAMHGTGNPPANDLFDGDIHALVERDLEWHIDSLAGRHPEYGPESVHLFANGAEGDVSPDWPQERLCPRATLRPVRRPAGPRLPRPPVHWDLGSETARQLCLAESRVFVDSLGHELGRQAIELYTSLRASLRQDLRVSSAFLTLRLRENPALPSCPEPRVGTATVGGADDGRSRYYGWRVLGLFNAGMEESDASANRHPQGCQGRKRIAGGLFFQRLAAGPNGYPPVAQLMVIRVGDGLVAATPWEITTEAGRRILTALRAGAADAGGHPAVTALVGLANGYLQYLTTPEEYQLQHYEGASNLYGPNTQLTVARELRQLAGMVYRGEPGAALAIEARPGTQVDIFPRPQRRVAPQRSMSRPVVSHDTVTMRWIDAGPGELRPDLGPLIRIERRTTPDQAWRLLTWDDDDAVEVRVGPSRGNRGQEWWVRWSACRAGAEYRFVLPAHPGRLRDRAQPVLLPRVEPPLAYTFRCPSGERP